jgi:hypothetical protein
VQYPDKVEFQPQQMLVGKHIYKQLVTRSTFNEILSPIFTVHCGVQRVGYVLNTISRKAIERLGAKEDGILRNYKIMRNGRIRDTICYSIIQSEWPLVKQHVLQKMTPYI